MCKATLEKKRQLFHDNQLQLLENECDSKKFWNIHKSMNDDIKEQTVPQISEEQLINHSVTGLHSMKNLNNFPGKSFK